MVFKILFLVIALASFAFVEAQLRQKHPDVGLNVKQLIRKYKYPFQKHTTITEDGFILEIHRIPYGRNTKMSGEQPVAFLMPGVLCSSADWVNMGPEKSLGFILADKGYDVWLGNYRGTTWSRKHATLSPKNNKTEFFNYSFQEIGYYDAPAMIDYILNVTKQEKLFYIAHSQGTTTFMAMASTRPAYNDKIRLVSALAPVVYVDNLKSPLIPIAAKYLKELEAFVSKNEYYEVLKHSLMITILGQTFCNDDSAVQPLCAEKFQQYDYGEAENLNRYGQATPPEYDLKKITAPLALYYSDNDFLSSEIDVERVALELPNVVEQKLIKGYNHLDYLWAINVESTLYKGVIELMDLY